MKFTFPPNSGWFYEVWNHKTSILAGLVALVSLSLAHYAGFLSSVPLQIVAVAGVSLAKGVTTTFLFYLFFCAVSARVLIAIVQLATLPFLALSDRLGRGFRRTMDWPRQRRFVRTHSETIKWEGIVWILMQALLFLFLMLGIYIKFSVTWLSGMALLLSIVLVVLSGLVRSGFFLQPKPRTFIRKIRTRRVRSGRTASATFVTITGALVVVAFFMGAMRASLLRDQTAQRIVTKEFTGMAAVIASSEGALLLFQKQNADLRYIYSAPEFTTSIETKPVFPPIGNKEGPP